MKTMIGAAVGVLVLGLLLVVAGIRGAVPDERALAAPALQSHSPAVPAAPVLINCGPNQRSLVRQVLVDGQAATQVDCVTDTLVPAPGAQYHASGFSQAPVVSYAGDARAVPAVSMVPAAQAPQSPRVVTERRVVSREPAGRSWQKRALIIGGSAASGAGIGGLVGGKKGALIGAAIGGGGSSIYEATRK
jgi:hypothetical protein